MTGTFRHATFSLRLSSHFQIHNELWNWHFNNRYWINRRLCSKLFEWLLYFSFLEDFARNDPVIIYSLRFQACMTFFLQWNTKGNVLDNVNAALILYIESMPGTDECSLKVSSTIIFYFCNHICLFVIFWVNSQLLLLRVCVNGVRVFVHFSLLCVYTWMG